jgi:ribosome-binding factor A
MVGKSTRQLKFGRQLQKDLSEIFQKDFQGAFGSGLITITDVEVSPDLSVAKIYLSFLGVSKVDDSLSNVKQKTSQIRGALGRKIGKQVRIIPELVFFHDNSAVEGARMDQLLAGLNIKPADENTDEEE